jgi:hypothetical protein
MNTLYPIARQNFLTGQLNWTNNDIRIALFDNTVNYTPTHTTIGQVGTPISLGSTILNRTATNGMAAGSPTVYNGLTNPVEVAVAVLYRSTDGLLIAYMDQVNGFTFLPTGADYTLSPGGTNGAYFSL